MTTPADEDGVGRMQFLLSMRQRGITDAAVLRALDEVPRAPFDRIIITAAADAVPETLVQQLADGGVMVLPLGPHAGTQHLVRLTKVEGQLTREQLIAVRFVPLLHGQAREL